MDTIATDYERALALFEHGMPLPALELLKFRLVDEPDDAQARELKGSIHYSLGDFQQGMEQFEAARQHRQLSFASLLALADCYYCLGNTELARTLYYQLAQVEAFPFELLSGLAKGLSQVEEFTLATEACKQAAWQEPQCHQARYGVAYYMSKSGYPPELIVPVINEVIGMAPAVFHYRVAAVTMLCRMNQADQAYLAIADATTCELHSITCHCCLVRLAQLYDAANDERRAVICISQLDSASGSCSEE